MKKHIFFTTMLFTCLFATTVKASLPTKYDGRDFGLLPDSRTQTSGNCWAYASIYAMECNLYKQGKFTMLSPEFFEQYAQSADPLQNSVSDTTTQITGKSGGDVVLPASMVSNGLGPCTDNSDPFGTVYQANCIRIIPSFERDLIKECILTFGGGAMEMYIDSKEYPTTASEFAFQNFMNSLPNHVGCVIGWDDNYTFENKNIPKGAWLLKDPNGFYVWISYADASLLYRSTTCFYELSERTYDNLYRRDGSLLIDTISGRDGYLELFDIKGDQTITGFTIPFHQISSSPLVTIYKNPVITDKVMTDYDDAYYMSLPVDERGFFTYNCDPISVKNGDRIGIYLSLATKEDSVFVHKNGHQIGDITNIETVEEDTCFYSERNEGETVFYDFTKSHMEDISLAMKILTTGQNDIETPVFEKAVQTQYTDHFDEVTHNGIIYVIDYSAQTATATDITTQKRKKLKESKNKSVTIEDEITYQGSHIPVTGISQTLFMDEKNIQKVVLGKNITRIPFSSFTGSKNLKTIVLKGKIKYIGRNAFSNTNLKKIVSPYKIPKFLRKRLPNKIQITKSTS